MTIHRQHGAAAPRAATATPGAHHAPHQNHAGYRIAPITRDLEDGWFACSVSIRSGTGQQTTDRVLRLTRLFNSSVAAADYALSEGRRWVATLPCRAVAA